MGNSVNWVEFAKLLTSKLQKTSDEAKILSILLKLKAIPMTFDILKLTKIGKIVNDARKQHHKNEDITVLGKELIANWKEIAANTEIHDVQTEFKRPTTIANDNSTNHNHTNNDLLLNAFHSNTKNLIENLQKNSLSSSNATNEAKCHINNHSTVTTNKITCNYQATTKPFSLPKEQPPLIQNEGFFLQKNKSRTQVYSGRKTKSINHAYENGSTPDQGYNIPSLYNLCLSLLISRIDDLEYLGVPSDILAPILSKCNAKQLFNIEFYNEYLINDTDGFWEKHAAREFKSAYTERKTKLDKIEDRKKRREQDDQSDDSSDQSSEDEYEIANESWREFYIGQLEARENRLKKITANISATIKKADPGPRVKLAFMSGNAKPPRNIARKQALNHIPSSHSMTHGYNHKQGFANKSKTSILANSKNFSGSSSSHIPSSSSSFITGTTRVNTLEIDREKYNAPMPKAAIKRTAPMMDKTLKLFNRCKTRR